VPKAAARPLARRSCRTLDPAMWVDPKHVSLRLVTAETVRAVCALAVSEGQGNLVAPNAVSLAEALFSPRAWYRAVYLNESVVGFVMLYDETLGASSVASPKVVVWRLMIDARSQGKGIGRAALLLVVEHARSKRLFSVLSLSYVPAPGCAEKFYLDLGFKPTGKVEDGEVELEFLLNQRVV
jgi:diamine N-acetyltransferase